MDLQRVLQQYNKLRAETSICVTNNDGVVDGVSKESYFWGIVTVWQQNERKQLQGCKNGCDCSAALKSQFGFTSTYSFIFVFIFIYLISSNIMGIFHAIFPL